MLPPSGEPAYCYRRSSVRGLSICLSVTIVSPAETTEPIEMPFGMWTRVDPSKEARIRWECTLAQPGEYD